MKSPSPRSLCKNSQLLFSWHVVKTRKNPRPVLNYPLQLTGETVYTLDNILQRQNRGEGAPLPLERSTLLPAHANHPPPTSP